MLNKAINIVPFVVFKGFFYFRKLDKNDVVVSAVEVEKSGETQNKRMYIKL